MKKFLSVLFGLMFLQNAYCVSVSIRDTNLRSEILDYRHDKMDEKAIRALCEKLLNYAWMHYFNVLLEYGEGKIFSPSTSECKKEDIKTVSWILEGAAMQLVEKTFEKHSQCAQDLMKHNAFLNCVGFQSSHVRDLKNQGFTVDFNESNTIIDCSETDKRCVVNRPISQGGASGYLSVCCSIPVYYCDESKSGSSSFTNARLGYVGVHAIDIVGSARTLNDFDYGCQPIDGQ